MPTKEWHWAVVLVVQFHGVCVTFLKNRRTACHLPFSCIDNSLLWLLPGSNLTMVSLELGCVELTANFFEYKSAGSLPPGDDRKHTRGPFSQAYAAVPKVGTL